MSGQLTAVTPATSRTDGAREFRSWEAIHAPSGEPAAEKRRRFDSCLSTHHLSTATRCPKCLQPSRRSGLVAAGDRSRLDPLERAGFVDVTETRLDVPLDYRDDAEALGAAFLGGPVALAYAMFDSVTRQQASDAYLESIAAFRCGDGSYSVPGEFVVASGHRPSTSGTVSQPPISKTNQRSNT